MPSKRHIRLLLLVLLVVSTGFLVNGYLTSTARGGESNLARQSTLPAGERDQIADARNGTTVITTSSRPGSQAEIVAFAPNGSVRYYNDSFRKFFDVDPVGGTRQTVEYVASRNLKRSKCPIEASREECILNAVVRVNLSTGDSNFVYKRVTHKDWHDVDRLGPDRLLVADIAEDRVFVVNTTTGVQSLAWDAQSDYPITGGGFYPDDWTHMNDVELVDGGRIMVSLRNQDQVVFVDPETGLQENWTLGAEDERKTLYEQHNPDYIPESRGGPAVLVADSENNRVVEYQRNESANRWNESWAWSDANLQWPRDADRLPNGHTLVADSNGNRILEIDQSGDVVWSVSIDTPYEVERLGTGDESAGGESASRLGLASHGDTGAETNVEEKQRHSNPSRQLWTLIKGLVPSLVINGVVFIMPAWVGFRDVLTVVNMGVVGVVWAALEFRWSTWELQSPLRRR